MSEEDGYSYHTIDELEDLCSSEYLSLVELQKVSKDDILNDIDICHSSFLHRACMNENVTLEIVDFLLELYAGTIHRIMDIFYEHVVSAFPLHLACYNEKCPNEVIQLLLRKSPGYRHLTHIGSIEFDWGNTRDMGYDNDYGGTILFITIYQEHRMLI